MTAKKILAKMEELASTSSIHFNAFVEMGGKEKSAPSVSIFVCAIMLRFPVLLSPVNYHCLLPDFLLVSVHYRGRMSQVLFEKQGGEERCTFIQPLH